MEGLTRSGAIPGQFLSSFFLVFTELKFLIGVSLVAQESTCNAGDLGCIPGWGSAPGGRRGNPL